MANDRKLSRKEARKLAQKEAKRQRKLENKALKKELKELKREQKRYSVDDEKGRKGRNRRRNGRKYKVKKRFILFIILLVAVLAAVAFAAVQYGMYVFNEEKTANKTTDNSPAASVTNVNEVFDAAKPVQIEGIISNGDSTDGSGKKTTGSHNNSMEYKICEAIISDWHISPLTQTKDVIVGTFGDIYRYEDWNGGIYYHKSFPETMYITYNGDVKGKQPASGAICDSVSICIKNIIQFEPFLPDSDVWGKVNKTKSDEGWTQYFYSLMIKSGVNLIVYCDKDGNVDQETHIIVRKV